MLANLLELLSNEVRVAHDRAEAVEAAAVFRPGLTFLDLGMPELNGYEVARRIRRDPWGRETALAARTGWGQEEDRRRSKEAGFDLHLVKPVEPSELERLLRGNAPR